MAVITRTWQAAATVWQAKQKQQQQKVHTREKCFLIMLMIMLLDNAAAKASGKWLGILNP